MSMHKRRFQSIVAFVLMGLGTFNAYGQDSFQSADELWRIVGQLPAPVAKVTVELDSGQSKSWPRDGINSDDSWPTASVKTEITSYLDGTVEPIELVRVIDGEGAVHDLRQARSASRGETCEAAGNNWRDMLGAPPDRANLSRGAPVKSLFVFDLNGQLCYRNMTRITEGDLLYIGVFGPADEVDSLRLTLDPCSLQSAAPVIQDTTSGVRVRAGELKLRTFPPQECFDSSLKVQVRKAGGELAFEQTIKQYNRFRGSFQIGVLWTTLEEESFSVRTMDDESTIVSDFDGSRGPQYVASLVVYGLPYYVESLWKGHSYAGRDIVNENDLRDRLGFVLSLGLDDPKDTFGIGLSFELISGINVTATQYYRRLKVLDGVSVGDAFTGMTSDLPLTESWEDEFVIGLSLDGRYLAKFFGGGN
jgi:hypothetical protein